MCPRPPEHAAPPLVALRPSAAMRAAFGPHSLPQTVAGLRALDDPHGTDAAAPAPRLDPRDVSDWGDWRDAASRRASAVVVLLIPPAAGEHAARLVLTRRSTALRSHRGQIGFAGGRADLGDPTPAATALRELEEELGLARARVEPLGYLAPTSALERSVVVPLLALAAVAPEELTPSPAEVAEVLLAPWTAFMPSRDRAFRFNIFGDWRASHLFEPPGFAVWGLTARILASAQLA